MKTNNKTLAIVAGIVLAALFTLCALTLELQHLIVGGIGVTLTTSLVVLFIKSEHAKKETMADFSGQIAAISKSNAVVEFNMDGTIIRANHIFLNTMEYSEQEIENRHHRMFCEPAYIQSADYQDFWDRLNKGEFIAETFKRLTKSGKEVYLQATYNPIRGLNGKPFKVVKYATNVSSDKIRNSDFKGQLEAINKSNAVIEFNMDGTIIYANDNFLNTVGYSMGELKDNHHRMLCEPSYAGSLEYKQFWDRLNRGEFIAESFKRVTKSGEEIYLQAVYNPVKDAEGNPYKVVKIATDITEEKMKSMDFSGQLEAIDRSNAVIEFNMDGTIITANTNFLKTVEYSLEEIQGQHHKIFCDANYSSSAAYKMFWDTLNRGEFTSETFKRITKTGREIYLQATYNPIRDLEGKPYKVVKFAADVTEEKMKATDFAGQLEAIGKSNAVIEFNMDGTVLKANDIFLQTVEYSFDEIKGNHHRMFCETQYANSSEYRMFWERLNQGEFVSETFKRITKTGREIYLQATYNPIKNLEGKPYKVVKFALDVTEDKVRSADFSGQLDAINKSNAVIEFNMDGTVRWANENFLDTVKYKLDEIEGKHHRIFCEPGYSSSAEYKLFWDRLNRGEFITETFKRVDKNGEEIFLQATYNPIKDLNGVPYKVVKFAIDVTQQRKANAATQEAANEVSRVINALDEGDLTQRYSVESAGELGRMGESLNKALLKLSNLISTIISSASSLGSASSQMSGSSQEMSQASTEQASSVEEISSSMEQMLANIQQNNNNAQETEKIASKAATEIVESNEAVDQTVTSMKMIADKISIIGEITRQTNLLALNAAVEAARAGEHGKGFAVVAAEVRKLAERSQVAASEINKVSFESVDIAQKSGDFLRNVVPNIQKTSDLVQEISAASIEQNSGAEQVNSAVQQLNQIVQQNASTAEELASSAEELGAQADMLREAVSFFKVEEVEEEIIPVPKKKDIPAFHSNGNNGANGNHKKPHKNGKKKTKREVEIVLDSNDGLDSGYERF
ncbi:MAG: PAS domain-containing protein [Ekhidna sp.]